MTLKPGFYQHYKGAEYQVLYLARHSETEEWLVVYQPCYGDRDIWVRPLTMFTENVTAADGTVVPRFRFIRESEGA
ncbi:MAG: DUF1653 domain-containing protein [Oceanospirillales bacterium]|nr:DUF1653 domain-containing protein [Oceanospirillales bacterium]MBR9889213.1 DUF1653 domain-containing protein [Oceanospirillales bacterium]